MIQKDGTAIRSLEEWERLAPPKSRVQWRDYRSAKESAFAWLGDAGPPTIPEEILASLRGHPDLGEILEWEAEPECLVEIDGYRGPANIDVMVDARDARGSFVIAIEAKADELFGQTVADALAEATERFLGNPRSKGVARIQELATSILGPARRGAPRLRQIRYQLLTLTAAALVRAAAAGADRTVALIHEFRTPLTKTGNHDRNNGDLARFLRRLTSDVHCDPLLMNQLVGPIRVPGGGRFEEPAALYIGKAVRQVTLRGSTDTVTRPAHHA